MSYLPIAMNRLSDYNPICCPTISAKLTTCNKNSCEDNIQMKWVICQLLWIGPLITIPHVALKFRRNSGVLKSRARWRRERVAHVRGSRMSRSHNLNCWTLRVNLRLPNWLVCWVSVSRMRQPCAQPGCKQLRCESKRISDFWCD